MSGRVIRNRLPHLDVADNVHRVGLGLVEGWHHLVLGVGLHLGRRVPELHVELGQGHVDPVLQRPRVLARLVISEREQRRGSRP